MTATSLAHRTALVTGSCQGIGLAIATRLAADGARVILHDLAGSTHTREALEAVRAAGAPDACFISADLRAPHEIDGLMDEALGWRDGVDILVNNAGVQFTASLVDMPPQRWDDILAVNLSSAFHTMRRALPGMIGRGYGRIVNVASVHGMVASVAKAPYVAAKFGLVGLTRVAALECASAGSRESGGITANCIGPGWTETALIEPQIQWRADQFGGDRVAGVRDMLREKQPSLRMSLPSEIGELACMLCQPWAHNITGATIPVDGGWTAQ
ncbi:MAG TPA: SDR family NAD(P)-dependent oxidoreductase [Burkholderiaceae bacterium]